MKGPSKINLKELSTHTIYGNCWIAIEGSVYDVSSYIDQHPGGDIILAAGGTDATILFNHYHIQGDAKARMILEKFKIGVLVEAQSPIMGTFYNTLKKKVAQKLDGISPRPWHAAAMFFFDLLSLIAVILFGAYVSMTGRNHPMLSFALPLFYSIANMRVAAQTHAVTHMQIFTKDYVHAAINFIACCGSRSLGGYDFPDRQVQIRYKLGAPTRTETQYELFTSRGPFEHQAIHHVREGTSLEGDQCNFAMTSGIFRFNAAESFKAIHNLQTNRFIRNAMWFARLLVIDAATPISCLNIVLFYIRIGIFNRVPTRLIGALFQGVGVYYCYLLPAYKHFGSFLLARFFLSAIGDFMTFFFCQHRWDISTPLYDPNKEWGKYHASLSASLWGEYMPWHPIVWGYGQGTCPSTLSYHLEHTLFPGINYRNLQIIAPVCEEVCKEFGVEYMKYKSITQIYEKIDADLMRAGDPNYSIEIDKKKED